MDNFTTFETQIDTAIDPNAVAGGILAQNHNDMLHTFVRMQGKYVGSPFVAKATYAGGAIAVGSLYFNGALNATKLTLVTSQLTADLNDFELVLKTLDRYDKIHIKDFEGRSMFFVFEQYAKVTVGLITTYEIYVLGDAGNVNYTYQPDEEKICIFEVVKAKARVIPFNDGHIYKKDGNLLTTLEAGDVFIGWLPTSNVIFLPCAQYIGGAVHLLASYKVNEIDFT